jgi:ferredoxin--NADP+ reductase
VAIVGAGPAGFYAAEALIDRRPDVEIDIIERLPTPFGLVRAGVAPDHQSTKRVAARFAETAVQDVVHFYGNAEIGRDVSLAELRGLYDAVVLAVGAPADQPLGIPGEHLRGVHGSSAFVGWYNGHPDFRDLDPDLGVETAVVIGNGNVALDVARVLLRTAEELAASDIAAAAARAIASSPLRNVTIIGRRGPAEAKFAPGELREMGELAAARPIVDPAQLVDRPAADGDRQRRVSEKNLAILRGFATAPADHRRKSVTFRFFLKPVRLLGDDRVEGVMCEQTRLVGGRLEGTGRVEQIVVGLVVAAIGYRGTRLPGVPYDDSRGLIANDDGRVGDRLYAVGWAKRGPTGVIGTNRPDGQRCAEQIDADFAEGGRPGRRGLEPLLAGRGVRTVTFDDWLRIDAAEVAAATGPAPRRKFTSLAEMLAVLGAVERAGVADAD